MSNPTQAAQKPYAIDPQLGLMAVAAEHLTAVFEIGPVGHSLANSMAVSALRAYQPETHADFVSAARIIAFSMAAVALLGKAAAQDMEFPEQMRAYGRANALHRSANQSERTMMQRRRDQRRDAAAEQDGPRPAPRDARADAAAVEAGVTEVMREYRAACPPKKAETVVASRAPVAGKSAVLQPPAVPSASAIRSSVAMPQAGPATSAPFKEALLRQSAIHRAGMPHGSG